MAIFAKRKQQLPLIAGAAVFLLAAVVAYQDNDIIFALIYVLMFALNFAALKFVERLPAQTNTILSLANALLSFYQSYQFFQIGKKGLPYAYLIAAVGFLITTYFTFKKQSAKPISD